MYKSILVPIDLADTDLAKPAIATAATLSQTWNGAVRLLNVLPMTPVMQVWETLSICTYFLCSFILVPGCVLHPARPAPRRP